MRVRTLVVVVTVAGLLAMMPGGVARAGGNWLDVRPDDGVPGGPWDSWGGPFPVGTALELRATMYARGAIEKRALHDDGPFYAWIVPDEVRVGQRVPSEAVRLDAFDLHWTGEHGVVATASITLPAMASGRYSILTCNDPCTLLGLGEGVQAWVGVTQTVEGATLQRRLDRLDVQVAAFRRRLNRSDAREQEIRTALDLALTTRANLLSRITMLENQLAGAERVGTTAASPVDRTFVDPWVGVVIAVGLLAVAVALLVRRRPRGIIVPDTPEALFRSEERERRTADR